jgi:hypothetical protein
MEREIVKKSNGLLRARVELRDRFIAREKEAYPVTMRCRVPGVGRGGFDACVHRRDRDPDPEHAETLKWQARSARVRDSRAAPVCRRRP